jgi:hypothetical protein
MQSEHAQRSGEGRENLTRSRQIWFQHSVPENLYPGNGLGELRILCTLAQSVHFFCIDAPCIAIPDVPRPGE